MLCKVKFVLEISSSKGRKWQTKFVYWSISYQTSKDFHFLFLTTLVENLQSSPVRGCRNAQKWHNKKCDVLVSYSFWKTIKIGPRMGWVLVNEKAVTEQKWNDWTYFYTKRRPTWLYKTTKFQQPPLITLGRGRWKQRREVQKSRWLLSHQ